MSTTLPLTDRFQSDATRGIVTARRPVRAFYRDYMLSCESLLQDDGRYQARVAIICMSSDKTRSQRFLDLEAFVCADAATERARQAGMEWIDVNMKFY
jgi:hypothetical protein